MAIDITRPFPFLPPLTFYLISSKFCSVHKQSTSQWFCFGQVWALQGSFRFPLYFGFSLQGPPAAQLLRFSDQGEHRVFPFQNLVARMIVEQCCVTGFDHKEMAEIEEVQERATKIRKGWWGGREGPVIVWGNMKQSKTLQGNMKQSKTVCWRVKEHEKIWQRSLK